MSDCRKISRDQEKKSKDNYADEDEDEEEDDDEEEVWMHSWLRDVWLWDLQEKE